MALNSSPERKEFSEDMILEVVKPWIRREILILNSCSLFPLPEDSGARWKFAIKHILGTKVKHIFPVHIVHPPNPSLQDGGCLEINKKCWIYWPVATKKPQPSISGVLQCRWQQRVAFGGAWRGDRVGSEGIPTLQLPFLCSARAGCSSECTFARIPGAAEVGTKVQL